MPLVSELLTEVAAGSVVAHENELWTSCPVCEQEVRLDEAVVDSSFPIETSYSCPRSCGTILVVSMPGPVMWEDSGWRAGDWVIRNVRDLYWQQTGSKRLFVLRAREHALD